MKKLLATLTLVSFSAGCQSTTVISGCPPLVAYSSATQKQAAAELRRLPPGSPLAKMIVDYGKHRAACRVGGAE